MECFCLFVCLFIVVFFASRYLNQQAVPHQWGQYTPARMITRLIQKFNNIFYSVVIVCVTQKENVLENLVFPNHFGIIFIMLPARVSRRKIPETPFLGQILTTTGPKLMLGTQKSKGQEIPPPPPPPLPPDTRPIRANVKYEILVTKISSKLHCRLSNVLNEKAYKSPTMCTYKMIRLITEMLTTMTTPPAIYLVYVLLQTEEMKTIFSISWN